jgi:hypothetical protein
MKKEDVPALVERVREIVAAPVEEYLAEMNGEKTRVGVEAVE